MAIGALGLAVTFEPPYIRWLIWTCSRALARGSPVLLRSMVLADDVLRGRSSVPCSSRCVRDCEAVDARARAPGHCGPKKRRLRRLPPAPEADRAGRRSALRSRDSRSSRLRVRGDLGLEPDPLSCAGHRCTPTSRPLSPAAERRPSSFESQTIDLSAPICPSRPRSLRLWTHETSTRPVILRPWPSTRETSRRGLGLSEDEQQLAHLCGLVHDIGKVGLPAGLLEKPGALTLEERRRMEEHSAIGERILAQGRRLRRDRPESSVIITNAWTATATRTDSAETEIPAVSRIIAVADAYNAMTSGRPYRDAMPSRVARFPSCAGRWDTVRHHRGSGLRGHPRRCLRDLPVRRSL